MGSIGWQQYLPLFDYVAMYLESRVELYLGGYGLLINLELLLLPLVVESCIHGLETILLYLFLQVSFVQQHLDLYFK